MWGAGLSFHRCHAEINVPVDPYLDNVFDGEEGSRGIRFFTHGYDVYTPHRVLVTHDYHGHQSNPIVHTWGGKSEVVQHESHWKWMEEIEKNRGSLKVFGSDRVNLLLGIGNEKVDQRQETELIRSSRFGLGTKRTLEQAIEFTGINLRERKMEVNKCGNLLWVPYNESPNYGLEETLSRGYAGEVVLPPISFSDQRSDSASAREAQRLADSVGSPLRVRFAGQDLVHSSSTSATADYRLAGGLICAVLAVLVRMSTSKRKKDDKHKN
jgi:hypothetical protein